MDRRRITPPLLWLFPALLFLSAFWARPAAGQEPPARAWRFGVVEAYTAPNGAAELNASWTRVRFQWAEVQAEGPDSWTPELDDEQLAAELAAGREVVGLLIGIPDWARDDNRLPRGLRLDYDDPDNTWAVFVADIVERYAGRIDHWVIWNEPDIDREAIAHTWDGTVEDFYYLQRSAYLAAKAANPDAVIHLAAFTYWADFYAGREQYMARLLDRIAADPEAESNNYYFDVATAHLYFQPDQIYDLVVYFRRLLAEHGLDKPLWLVETNAPPHDDPEWPVAEWTLSVTQSEQASFMPQAVAVALAAGAERIAVYKLRDTSGDRAANPEPFGLMRQDGSRRVAYTTYREAIRYLSGALSAERVRWDNVGQIRVQQVDRSTTVLFARLPMPQTARVEAEAPRAVLVDMWGQMEEVTAEDGFYTIELQSPQCTQPVGDYCMIGGTTYYLIQARDGGLQLWDPPQPHATAPPPAAPLPSPTPTATPSPSATPPATATPLPTTAPPSPTAEATPRAAGTSVPLAAAVETIAPSPLAPSAASSATSAPATTGIAANLSWLLLAAALVIAVPLLWWGFARRR